MNIVNGPCPLYLLDHTWWINSFHGSWPLSRRRVDIIFLNYFRTKNMSAKNLLWTMLLKFWKIPSKFFYKISIEPNFHNMFVCVYIMHNLLKYKQMHTIDLELEKIYNKPNICLQYIMNKDTMALKTKKIKKSPLSKNNHVLRIIMKYWELKFEVYFFTSLALNWNPLQVYYQILPYIIILPRVFSF